MKKDTRKDTSKQQQAAPKDDDETIMVPRWYLEMLERKARMYDEQNPTGWENSKDG